MTTSTQTQIRRGTAAQCAAITPVQGELLFDTTNNRLRAGDGSRAGGWEVPNFKDIQNQNFISGDAGGTADALTITCTPVPAAYAAYQRFVFKASGANTITNPTLNVNSLGAKTLKKKGASGKQALAVGDLQSGVIYCAVYDGTDFQLEAIDISIPAGVVLLSTKAASGSAQLDFTSLITSAYRAYTWVLDDLVAATDNVALQMLTSSDNSTFDTGSNNYKYAASGYYMDDTTPSAISLSSGGDTKIALTGTGTGVGSFSIGNAAAEGLSGTIKAKSLLGTARKKVFETEIECQNTQTKQMVASGWAMRDATAIVNAVRFKMSSGNIATGKISMYGHLA